MAFFTSSEQRARSKHFDTWKGDTNNVLQQTKVQDALGDLGARLLEVNKEAFLPNVKHGEVSMPKSKVRTSAAAILPYSSAEHDTLKLGRDMLRPTPYRATRIAYQLALQKDSVIAQHTAAAKLVDRYLADPSEIGVERMQNIIGEQGEGAKPFTVSLTKTLSAVHYSSRPITVVNTDSEIFSARPSFRGAIGAHELVHAIDYENDRTEDYKLGCFSELRGLIVGATILDNVVDSAHFVLREQRETLDPYSPIAVEVLERNDISRDVVLNALPNVNPIAYLGEAQYSDLEKTFISSGILSMNG